MWSVLEAAKVRRVAAPVMHCANYVAEYAFCECLVKCDRINLLVLPPPPSISLTILDSEGQILKVIVFFYTK